MSLQEKVALELIDRFIGKDAGKTLEHRQMVIAAQGAFRQAQADLVERMIALKKAAGAVLEGVHYEPSQAARQLMGELYCAILNADQALIRAGHEEAVDDEHGNGSVVDPRD